MPFEIPQRLLEGIKKDIDALERSNQSSLETGVAMTTDIMTIFVNQIRAENPTLTESEVLAKARETVYNGRSKY